MSIVSTIRNSPHYCHVQTRNWKLTETVEELDSLRQEYKVQSEKAESLEGNVRELEEGLSRAREENEAKLEEMERVLREEKKVRLTGHS